jgi:hypothetical protein
VGLSLRKRLTRRPASSTTRSAARGAGTAGSCPGFTTLPGSPFSAHPRNSESNPLCRVVGSSVARRDSRGPTRCRRDQGPRRGRAAMVAGVARASGSSRRVLPATATRLPGGVARLTAVDGRLTKRGADPTRVRGRVGAPRWNPDRARRRRHRAVTGPRPAESGAVPSVPRFAEPGLHSTACSRGRDRQ